MNGYASRERVCLEVGGGGYDYTYTNGYDRDAYPIAFDILPRTKLNLPVIVQDRLYSCPCL